MEATVDADQARNQLYEIMKQDASFEVKAQQALELGEAYLDVENGHVTRIDPETDYWEAIASTDPPDGTYPPGQVLDLSTTYCRRTIASDSPIALHDAPNQGWADDPAFDEQGLHCYHGTTLTVDGEPYGTVCFVSQEPRDESFSDGDTMFAELIARMLEHELEYNRQQAELDRRETLLNVFGRVLRHNLRNDMSVIRGRIRMLTGESSVPDVDLDQIIDTIDDLFELGETARKFESIDQAQLERQPLELMTLIEEVVTTIRGNYPEAAVSIDGPDEVTVTAMPSLAVALEELIENAIKHSGTNPEATIAVEADSESIHIQVSDNGPGLPSQEQEVLTTGTETPLVHGSGLGLWLVHWIVANQDGELQSHIGAEGTTITVSLPRRGGELEAHTQEDTSVVLQKARDQFEAVFDESFDAMVISDDEGRYLEANAAAVDLFGTPYEELLGSRIDDFATDDFEFEKAWEQFQQHGQLAGEFTLVRPDGTERIVEFSATADIIPGQHLSVMRDVTEKAAEQQELQRKTRAMDAAPIGITISDPSQEDNPLIYVNDAFERVTGYEASEIIGQNCRFLQGPDTDPDKVQQMREAIDAKEPVTVELTNYRKDGSTFRNRVTIAPVRNDQGEVVNWVGFQEEL